jgi:hypothetical protein
LLSWSARLEASRPYLSLSRRLGMILLIRKIQPSIRGHSYFTLLLPVPAAHILLPLERRLACARHQYHPPDGSPRPNAGACTRRGEAAGRPRSRPSDRVSTGPSRWLANHRPNPKRDCASKYDEASDQNVALFSSGRGII